MSYKIKGVRITKMARDRLLRVLEHTDRDLNDALRRVTNERERGHEMRIECDAALERAQHAELERDTARAECAAFEADAQRWQNTCQAVEADRDHYKHESVDNWLKLTTSESNLSMAEARTEKLRRYLKAEQAKPRLTFWDRLGWVAVEAVVIALLLWWWPW